VRPDGTHIDIHIFPLSTEQGETTVMALALR
jgi:hypothetical protein